VRAGAGPGAAAVASFLVAVLTEIYLYDVCSCQEILRRNGRGQCAELSESRLGFSLANGPHSLELQAHDGDTVSACCRNGAWSP
jgi:hypothetical protein